MRQATPGKGVSMSVASGRPPGNGRPEARSTHPFGLIVLGFGALGGSEQRLREGAEAAQQPGALRAGYAAVVAESAWSRADFAVYQAGRPSKMIVSAVVFSVRNGRIAT